MEISFDPTKREATLRDRGLDFEEARNVFAGATIISVGYLQDRMMVVVWTPRGTVRHIISMRKANDREKARYRDRLEAG